MALTAQFKEEVQTIRNMGERLLKSRDDCRAIIARWNLNDMFNLLTDADLAADPNLTHLTKDEVSNAIAAFQAFLTAMGDDVSGQATNLHKLK